MPGWLSNDVIASWLAELVAVLFAAAVTLSFRRSNPRADVLAWGWAWSAGALWALAGLVAYSVDPDSGEFLALRALARSSAFLQATYFLLGARSLTEGEGTPSWLRGLAVASPVLGVGSAFLSARPLPAALDVALRAMGSATAGAAALVAAAWILRRRAAQPGFGTRLMAVSLAFYGILKLVSPSTLAWLGLLEGAGPALYIGFSLAPVAFALGCAASLLEERERALAAEHERLRVSEEMFAKLFRSSPDAVILSQPFNEGLIVAVNDGFERMFGYSAAEAVGRTTVELGLFAHPNDRLAAIEEGLRAGRVRDRELEMRDRTGGQVWASVSADRIEIRGEAHAISVVRDISERKRAEAALRRNEELFRAVVEDQTEMIVRWRPDGTRTFVNQAYCRVFGGRAEDFVGTSFLPLVAEEYRQALHEKIRSLTPERPVATHVHESVTPAGERRWQEWTDRGIFDAAGRLVELQSTGRDVTESREAERRVRRSEELLRAVLEDQTEMIVRWRPDGTRTFVNEAYCRSLGRGAAELVGSDLFSSVPESRKGAVRRKIASLTPAAPVATDVHECAGAAGERRWQEWTDRGIFDESGRLVELQSTGRDVTESREAERRVQQSEERLRRMSEATFEGISISEGGVIVDANEQFARMHGYPLAELIGKPVVELVAPKDRPRVAEAIRLQLVAAYEILGLRKDGSSFPAEVRGRPLELGRRQLRIAAVRDMSEQSELLERLALVGRATNDAVWDWDLRTGELWWSEGIHTLFGYAQRSVRPELAWWSERIHPEDRERVNGGMHAAIAAGGQLWSDEYRFRRADGSYAEVLDRGFVLHGRDGVPLRMVGAMLDVTERKGAQEALRRSERMATVGALVAGVAHEVRTPLFGISANLDAYEGQLHEPEPRREMVELLRSQVGRLNTLMRDLLDYGRPQALQLQRGGIDGPIQRALRSCARSAEQAGVRLAAELGAVSFEVERDPGRLEQVFENLVSNAVAHSPRGGTVRVSVTAVDGPAPGVRCAVEDEGPGLSAEDLPRVFEPFFSRRKGGTGLGLAIVQQIVEEHGGAVRAENRAGRGAVFSVLLPLAAASSGPPNSTSGAPDGSQAVGSSRSQS